LASGDVSDIYNNWAKDPEVSKNLTWHPHKSEEESAGLLAGWLERYNDPTYYHWGVELKETGRLIGTFQAVNLSERDKSIELAYCMGQEWWGRGLMVEAVEAVIAHFFESVGFNRVYATHFLQNPNSGKVMLKAGMKYEGVLRQARWFEKFGFMDLAYYSILKSEYNKEENNNGSHNKRPQQRKR